MSTEFDITATLDDIVIGATGAAEIIQNVKTILATVRGTVPLDRDFGVSGEWLDKPLPVARALYMADVVDEVERQEPRVNVVSVRFDDDTAGAMDGKLSPVIRIKIKEGIL